MTPTPTAPAPQGGQIPPQSQDDLIKRFQTPISRLFRDQVQRKVDSEKIVHYQRGRRNEMLYRNQRAAPRFRSDHKSIDYIVLPSGSSASRDSNGKPATSYNYRLNYFRGDMRKYVGILGHKSPNAVVRPKFGSDDSSEARVEEAGKVLSYLRADWDPDRRNPDMVFSLAKTGTSFFHTPWEVSPETLGEYEEPTWTLQSEKLDPDGWECPGCGVTGEAPDMGEVPPNCPACGYALGPENWVEGESVDVPVEGPPIRYPLGRVGLYVYNSMNVTTPFWVKPPLTNCPWLWLQTDDDAAELIAAYPWAKLDQYLGQKPGDQDLTGGAVEEGRNVRAEIAAPTSLSTQSDMDVWTRHRVWFKPSYYVYLYKSRMGPGDPEIESLVSDLRAQFPRGLKATFINGTLVQMEHSVLSEEWVEVMPEMNDTLWADAIFHDYVIGQELMNNAWSILIRTRETAIPATIYNTNVLHPNVINGPVPINGFIPAASDNQYAMDLSKAFAKIPTSEPNSGDHQFIEKVQDTLREIIGLLPAAFGGEGPAQTAEEARRRLNQALLVLSTTWNQIRTGWSRAYYNAIRQIAKYSMGKLALSDGSPETAVVFDLPNTEDLLSGGYYVECDQAIPVAWTQLRDFILDFTAQNPLLVDTLGVNDPDNLTFFQQASGIPGWKVKNQDIRAGIKATLMELAQSAPLVSPMGVQPSLEFNPVLYPPPLVMELGQKWLLTDGRKLRQTPGYSNVLAFVMAADAAMKMAMAPPPGEEGGPPPDAASGAPAPSPNNLPPDAPDASLGALPPDIPIM